jgi:hypothetical protein
MGPKQPCGARASMRFSVNMARQMIINDDKDDCNSSEKSCSSYRPFFGESTGKDAKIFIPCE